MAEESRSETFDKHGEDQCLKNEFEKATQVVREIAGSLKTDQQLFLYSRYKQGVLGQCNVKKPSFLDLQGKQKWSAWKDLGDMSSQQAMIEYIEEVTKIVPDWKSESNKPQTKKKNIGPVQSVLLNTEAPLADHEKTVFDFVKENNQEMLLKHLNKSNINEKDTDGMTLLHWASDRSQVHIAQVLIELGADVNCRDNEGQTPLHFAYSCEHQDIVDLLLSSGADKTICDNDGNRPDAL